MHRRYKVRQASESLMVGCLLSASGGLQDAYTYNIRDAVFANAQTGNIVLLGQNLALGNWEIALRYLLPLLAFAAGIYLTEVIHGLFPNHGPHTLHWRHGVLLLEIAVLLAVGWMPQRWNLPANMLVSFVCAMQVEAFRTVEGNSYATTMCIGNLRSAMENLYYWRQNRDGARRHKAGLYFMVITFFLIGASVGGVLSPVWEEATVWLCCPLLLLAFVLMVRIHSRRLRFLEWLTGVQEDDELDQHAGNF